VNSQRYRVLVIDDEDATLTMFRLFLTAYGYDVAVAENGRIGIELVRTLKPDIVFTDLKMPEMDGFEVLKVIKKTAPKTEVIVITGHGDMDLVIQALNLDATDFINKPIRRTSLDAALQRAVERLQYPSADAANLSVRCEKPISRITIEGTLGRRDREGLTRSFHQAREAGASGVVVNFARNAAFNGDGISELISCFAASRREGLTVAVAGLSENFRDILKMVGLARFASLYETEAQALAALENLNSQP